MRRSACKRREGASKPERADRSCWDPRDAVTALRTLNGEPFPARNVEYVNSQFRIPASISRATTVISIFFQRPEDRCPTIDLDIHNTATSLILGGMFRLPMCCFTDYLNLDLRVLAAIPRREIELTE